MNGQYIRQMPVAELTGALAPFLARAGFSGEKKFTEAVVAAEASRLKKLSDITERTAFYFAWPEINPYALIWKKSSLADTKENLKNLAQFLANLSDEKFSSETALEQAVKSFIEDRGLDNGSVLWPMRVALSGLEASPGPFQIAHVLWVGYGKSEILERIQRAIGALN